MFLNIIYDYKITDIGEPEWYQSVYKEIWLDHEYSRYGVEVESGDIVVDCGANVGFFTLYALHKGAKHVYSVECEDKNIDCLNHNLQNQNSTIIKGFIGIGENDISIDKLMVDNNLSHIDFIKVDIEWGEYPLLNNISDDTMKKVDKWVIELHDIYGNYEQIFNIIEKFSKNGFNINYEQVHKNTNLALLYAKKK